MKRRTLLAGLAAVGLLAAFPVAAQTYKSEYKLSTVVGKPFPWGIGGERWADLVREQTQGRINIKMYPGTSLVGGDQTREFTAMRQGAIDLAIGSTINWSPQVKELNLFSLPFLMPDYKAIDALTQGEVGKELFKILEKHGVVPLAWGENGFREMTNSKRAISTPDDLKGLKFRVVGSPLFIDTFTALGANPTQMSWADAQPALATGAVDGQENPLTIFTVAKLHTVGQKYVTLWGYVADPLVFVVNQDVWKSWSEADRKIVREAALQAGKEEHRARPQGPDRAPTPARSRRSKASASTVTKLSAAEQRCVPQGDAAGLRQMGAAPSARTWSRRPRRRSRSASSAASLATRPHAGPLPHAGEGFERPTMSAEPDPTLGRDDPPTRVPVKIEEAVMAAAMALLVRHHLRQRCDALPHQHLLRLHRGIFDQPDGDRDPVRHRGRDRRGPPHPHRLLRGPFNAADATRLSKSCRWARPSSCSPCWSATAPPGSMTTGGTRRRRPGWACRSGSTPSGCRSCRW